MREEPDVRLDGVSHEQILEWVHKGRAAKSTLALEKWLQSIINALQEVSDEVNKAVHRTNAGDWEGTTVVAAAKSMTVLRDFDEELRVHGAVDRDSAMGQSGESAATRNRVPPIPLHLDAQPTILGSTADPKVRIDARREAEEQARLVMAEYQEATRRRLAQLPQIPPVPTVVLDTSTDEPGGPGGSSGPSADHRPAAKVPVTGVSVGGGKQATAKPSSSPKPNSNSKPAETPGQDQETSGRATTPQAVGPASVSPAGAARGDPATAGSPAVVGGIAAVPIGGNTATPGGEPEVVEDKSGQRAEPGPRSAVERVGERQQVTRETTQRRTTGTGGLMGGATGTPTDKQDEEHRNRYHLPSEEPFETDEEYLRDGEFFVAPDVIGGPE